MSRSAAATTTKTSKTNSTVSKVASENVNPQLDSLDTTQKGRQPLKQPNSNVTELCWATKSDGSPCRLPCARPDGIPYCETHFRHGDSAVKVVDHDLCPEILGKILVAQRDLPKGYKFVYWGSLLRCSKVPQTARDHCIEFCPLSRDRCSNATRGMIDPTPHANSVLQFAMMPGPGEVSNLCMTTQHFGATGKQRTELAARVYKVSKFVPAGTQIAHDYGNDWLKQRGIKRMNVGTSLYPMPLKKRKVMGALV